MKKHFEMRLKKSVFLCTSLVLLLILTFFHVHSLGVGQNVAVNQNADAEDDPKNATLMLRMVSSIFSLLDLKKAMKDLQDSQSSESACYACKFGMTLAQHLVESGKGADDVGNMTYRVCRTLKIETDSVCKGMVNLYKV